MATRTRTLIVRSVLFAFTAFTFIARAADALPIPPVASEPDHLVPVDPYPGDWHTRYTDQLRARFELHPPFLLQMLVRPSFTPEYAVCLHGEKGKASLDFTPAGKVFLTVCEADKNIWYAMPENNDSKRQQDVKITRKTVDFPQPLSTRLLQLWERMLRRTRYPEAESTGFDGTTYEFSTWGMHGQVWSPIERQSPRFFIELGNSLLAYGHAAPAEQPAAAKEIESKAAQLEKYLNEHPPRLE